MVTKNDINWTKYKVSSTTSLHLLNKYVLTSKEKSKCFWSGQKVIKIWKTNINVQCDKIEK